jgi:hypothetical protein
VRTRKPTGAAPHPCRALFMSREAIVTSDRYGKSHMPPRRARNGVATRWRKGRARTTLRIGTKTVFPRPKKELQ